MREESCSPHVGRERDREREKLESQFTLQNMPHLLTTYSAVNSLMD
jgi:hypothetical protein